MRQTPQRLASPRVDKLSLVPAPHVYHQQIEGETVLLAADEGLYFSLDRVGTRVWQLLVQGCDTRELKARMLAEFDVDDARLESDLNELLRRLEATGLVVAA